VECGGFAESALDNPTNGRRRRTATIVGAALATLAIAVGAAAAAAASQPGIDVSGWQHKTTLDWSKVASTGAKFTFIKATEGTSYVNPYLAGDWVGSGQVGLYHGAYDFARPVVGNAVADSQYFVKAIPNQRAAGVLPPVLDLEATGGLSVAQLRTWVANWLTSTESLTGRTPIIYVSPSFWVNAMGNSTAFHHYPLWIAHYGVASPTIPGGWPTWTFWQGTSTGTVTGISGSVDMDAFNGTLAALQRLANASVTAKPSPTASPTPTSTASPTAPATATATAKPTLTPTATATPTVSPKPVTATKLRTVVTLRPGRARVARGDAVGLFGKVTTASGAAVAAQVRIMAMPSNTTTWRLVATTASTTASGSFHYYLRNWRTTRYEAVLPVSARYLRGASPVVVIATP